MPQGGLDWETIAMVAAVGSSAVIGWDWIAARGGERSDARKGLLEVAWPVLFIAVMGLLLKFTDFAAVLKYMECSRRRYFRDSTLSKLDIFEK